MDNQFIMPRRFDYASNYAFNTSIDALLKDPATNTVVLDCDAMEYIDSVGVGLLVMAHKKSLAVNKTITMKNIADSVRETLILTNIQKLIQFT